jgi:hypothetical protein
MNEKYFFVVHDERDKNAMMAKQIIMAPIAFELVLNTIII